jgi:multiple sugar transport system permease protein
MAYQSTRNRRIFLIFLLPVVAVLFLATLYAMFYAGWLSFRNYDLAKPFIPRIFVGWANYAEILSSGPFLHALVTTFKLMAITPSVQLVLGVGIALLVTQKLPGMGIARTLLLIPMMISPVIVGLVWLFLHFPELGYLNYFLGLSTRQRLLPWGGGLPVVPADKVIGGVGVSGATEPEDTACAEAGLRALGLGWEV